MYGLIIILFLGFENQVDRECFRDNFETEVFFFKKENVKI